VQLSSATSEERIREALRREALETWGPARLPFLEERLAATARQIWLVLQLPLGSLDDEPDFPAHASRLPLRG
jgi:hypothetical protein